MVVGKRKVSYSRWSYLGGIVRTLFSLKNLPFRFATLINNHQSPPSRLHHLNGFYNPLIVLPDSPCIWALPTEFLYLRHRPHGHSQGLSFPLGYTYTRGLLRSWKINRHDISAARPRLEAGWNNGGSSLQSLFRVERGAIAKSDLWNCARSFGTYKYPS